MNTVTGIMNKKIRNRSAFTLAEALVTILILLMVTVIVAAGIPAASRAYRNVVDVSNAEVVLSTTMITLRNELGLSKDVVVSSDKKSVTYYNEAYDSISKLSVADGSEDGIMYERFAADIDMDDYFGIDLADSVESKPERLITKEASNEDMYVKFKDITPDGKVITFNKLAVYKIGSDKPLVERNAYSIRVVSG